MQGMIGAFKSIALADEVLIQLVASGIYKALIAIVVISAYNLFMEKIEIRYSLC